MRTFTSRAAHLRGDTVVVTVRLPRPIVEFIDGHQTEELRNRSDFLQHWAAIGCLLTEREEE